MTRTLRPLAGSAVLALAWLLLGCASGSAHKEAASAPTSASAADFAPADSAVDFRDPQAVCAAFADALHRIDTAADRGPEDAYRRAAAYVDAPLSVAIANQPAVRSSHWQEWADHHAHVDVRVEPYPGDALAPDTDRESRRAVVVTATLLGRDGWRAAPERHTVFCTLHPAGGSWRIARYEAG